MSLFLACLTKNKHFTIPLLRPWLFLGISTDLKAMTGNEVEIGTRGDWQALTGQGFGWEVSVYYMALKHEILSTADPASGGDTNIAFNADKTIHAGLEALLSADIPVALGHQFSPKITLTYNHFKFKQDALYGNNTIANAPRFMVNSEWLYRQDSGFYIGPTLDWLGSRYVDYANTKKIAGYHLFGFKLGIAKERWNIYFDARNLNNKRYISTISIVDVYTAGSRYINSGAPRAFYMGWSYRY